jgi:hypothetical protein
MMLADSDIQKIAEGVLKAQLASSKIVECRVNSELDFDGELIVRVTAVSEIPVDDARLRLAANTAIQDQLHRSGDERYVFLDIELSSEQTGDEEDDQEPEQRQAQ